jgi:hypothetical protein
MVVTVEVLAVLTRVAAVEVVAGAITAVQAS